VALGNDGQPHVEIERQPPRGRDAKDGPGRVRRFDILRRPDPLETQLQRRARRQALALMAASSLLMLLILYGAWMALRGH
jgi:hypothetical protein